MSNYRLGADLERAARTHLDRDGYITLRSAGSRTPIDLVAFKAGQILFVQVKRTGALPVRDWNRLYDLAVELDAVPLLATGPGRAQLAFHRLTGRRAAGSRTYPSELFVTDEVTS